MALTVGQLVAHLKVDKGTYTADMKSAKGEAADLGSEIEKSGSRGSRALSGLAATARQIAPALTVGAILGAGWNRLTGIEDAQAKLKGLGHDAADIKTIMDDALTSVKGTAFGLDEAVSVAATATAAGIASGKELESTLRLVADTAAITGSSMANMGSIFNKVAAIGHLTTETMQQLQDQGVPVLVKLAEHYGVTTAEAQKMVTQSKVSFADFASVMKDTVGGAALAMGETTDGTLKNMGAAFSRLGAGILAPIAPYVKDLADGVIVLADGFGKLPEPVKAAAVAMGAFVALKMAASLVGMTSAGAAFVAQLRLIRTEGLAASGVLSTIGKAGAIGLATVAVTLLVKSWQDYNTAMADANQLVDANTGKQLENAKASVATALAQKGYLDIAQRAGIQQGELSDAILNGGSAYDAVIAKIKAYQGVIANAVQYKSGTGMFAPDSAEASQARDDLKIYYQFLHDVELQRTRVSDAERDGAAAAREAAATTNDASGAMERYVGELMAHKVAADSVSVSTGQASSALTSYIGFLETRGIQGQKDLAAAARDSAAAIDEANVAYNRSAVGLVGAQADAAEAMRDAGLAAKESGDSIFDSAGNFDLAQKSVRDMVGSLGSYRDAAVDSINATYQQTRASEGTVAAQQAAQNAALGARQGFIDMATSIFGVSIPAASAIADQLGFLQGIKIDDKTFTVTMVRRTVDVAVAEGALGDSWMRRINQDAAAAASSAQNAFTPPSIGDLIKNIPAPPKSGGGKSSGGKSAAEKAAADALAAAKKAAAERQRLAEEAAKREAQRQIDLAKTVSGTLDQIGKSVQKPFDLASMSLQGIVSQMAKSERTLANALANGLDPKAAKPLQDQLLSLAKEAGKQFQQIQLKIKTTDFDNLRSALTGTVSDVQSAVKALQADLRSVGAPSGVIAAITAKEDQLTAAMSEREDVVRRLGDAQSNLNNILSQYDQRVQQVTGSMQSYASLTNLVSGTEMDGFGANTLITSMQERASAAQSFTDGIAKLKAAGLNDTTLNQLIDAGPASAANQVQALVGATSAQIQQLNSLASQVFGAGKSLGTLSAESMYRTGISAAQSVVNGLQSQRDYLTSTITHLADGIEMLAQADMKLQGQRAMDGLIDGLNSKNAALNKAMKGIGAGMLTTFKTSLGIHSPSKVMAEQVGVPIIDGIIVGMNSRAGALDSTGINITGGLAGGSGAVVKPAVAGASGPIVVELIVSGDGPLTDAITSGARAEVRSSNDRIKVELRKGGDPWR